MRFKGAGVKVDGSMRIKASVIKVLSFNSSLNQHLLQIPTPSRHPAAGPVPSPYFKMEGTYARCYDHVASEHYISDM